jgi:predicted adenylyl cyclase CyaB
MVFECEVRSFISKEEFGRLLKFFRKNARLVKIDTQETFYFDGEHDLRIQTNKFHSKIWMKKGKIHDDSREEIEVKTSKEDFDNLERLFTSLGYNINIKWFRNRFEFDWENISVCLDFTKGYGYIIELEMLCEKESQIEQINKLLNEKLLFLKISKSSKEEFNEKFEHYKKNWKDLAK